ncbi:UNVERIFIED_CONTAM: putative serine/threonine-protein kinase PIX13 [Sesamum latifolium]|uniref:Serine/threonine-protein kinase PIX13 n=1 Tax=Sesamum latifolium TaxID=2727402 RepID=A0AAW2Y9D4_9LAMI
MPSKIGTGMMVAIKKLNPESMQGFEEWQSEVNFLGRLCHPNLVKLLGYCWEDKELLLIYEFMQKGSLENHLFRTKLGPSGGDSHVTTRVMGTYGYAAPEYVATGHLYVKSDVYGFGVVLLEMLTGLRALDTRRPSGQHNLVDWLKPLLSQRRKLKSYMDARIEGQYSSKAALQASQLTLRCLEGEPRKRPSMKEVVDVLEQIAAMEKPKESKNRSTHSSSQHNGQSPRPYRSPRHPSNHGTPTGAGR